MRGETSGGEREEMTQEWRKAIVTLRKNRGALTGEQVEKHTTVIKPDQAINKPKPEDGDGIAETSGLYINKAKGNKENKIKTHRLRKSRRSKISQSSFLGRVGF